MVKTSGLFEPRTMSIQYRSFFLYVKDGNDYCKNIVDVFLKTEANGNFVTTVSLIERPDQWPTSGACLRVDGHVKLVDRRKDFAIDFRPNVLNGYITTFSLRIIPSASARGYRDIRVVKTVSGGEEQNQYVLLSNEVYKMSNSDIDMPVGLTIAKRDHKKTKPVAEPSTPSESISNEVESEPIPSIEGLDIIQINGGISKLNTNIRKDEVIKSHVGDRKVVIPRAAADVNDAKGRIEKVYEVRLENELKLNMFRKEADNIVFDRERVADRFHLVISGDKNTTWLWICSSV